MYILLSEFGFFSMKLFNTSDKIYFGKHQWRSAFLWHPSSTKAWMTISGHKGAEDLRRRIRLIEEVIVWNTIWKFLFWKLLNIHKSDCSWSTKRSRAKANRVFSREHPGHRKHLFQQHKRHLYTWTTPNGHYWNHIYLYSLQLKMEKLYTVSSNMTWSWLWLRSWAPYCKT